MTRRHRLIALVAAGAALISGCGSVASSTEVARVDDQVLDPAALKALIGPEVQPINGEYPSDQVGGVINIWIWNTALRAELEDRGVDVPAPTKAEGATVTDVQTDAQAAFTALASYETSREWTADEIAKRYASVVCINVATVDTEDGANELIAALNGGTGFLQATELGASSGSPLGCSPPDLVADFVNQSLSQAGIQVDSDELNSLQPGAAIGPWPSNFGFIVLQRSSLTEAADISPEAFKGEAVLYDVVENHDISVSPLYGTFSIQGLRPLGAE